MPRVVDSVTCVLLGTLCEVLEHVFFVEGVNIPIKKGTTTSTAVHKLRDAPEKGDGERCSTLFHLPGPSKVP